MKPLQPELCLAVDWRSEAQGTGVAMRTPGRNLGTISHKEVQLKDPKQEKLVIKVKLKMS